MRFRAPARGEVAATRFEHPIFEGYRRHLDLLRADAWPPLSALNRRMSDVDPSIAFVEQDQTLLDDGQHYEQRIADQGRVATRLANWHDLFNALVWIEHTPLKRALNARQVADIACVGARSRTRAQYALTHFDEAGVIVLLREPRPLAAWDRHDWLRLFVDHGESWRHRIDLVVFGHALLEHALVPEASLVGKGLAVAAGTLSVGECLARLARHIEAGRTLTDPQQLRPLPMLGVPGWHEKAGTTAFYHEHPSFQPLRPGRHYPPAVAV